jgi:integrase
MASVSFQLKRPTESTTTVLALIFWPDGRVKVYTDVHVQPAHWNKEDHRVFKKHPGATLINQQLDLMEGQLLDCYETCRAAGTFPGKEQLKQAIAPEHAAVVTLPAAPPSVAATFVQWLDHKLTLSVGTLRSRQTTMRHLEGWQQAAPGRTLNWVIFTEGFLNSYAKYLADPKGRNLSDSAIWKSVDILKAFLRWAEAQGHPTGSAYQKYRWKKMEPAIFTLTPGELARIEELLLPAGGYLDNARALFLLGCYTGLRFSDVSGLRSEHIGENSLRVMTQKTKDDLVIPIRPQLRPLLAGVKAGTIRPIENQVLNRYLKELGKLAGLTDLVQVNRFQLGKHTTETKEKWQLLTMHVSRKCFITHALARKIRHETVMAVSGHANYKTFKRYVDVTATDILREFEEGFG